MSEALIRMTRPLTERVKACRDWPIWSLPRWLTAYVIAIVVADLAAIGVAARFATYSLHDLALFGLLLGCTAAAVEMARKAGERGGLLIKDAQGVWELPVAILLPPFYALIIPIVHTALTQWRVRHGLLHRRVFTAAAVSLSYGAASVTFHSLSSLIPRHPGGALSHDTVWTALVLFSALVKWALNKAMVITAVTGANRSVNVRTAYFGGEALYNDAAEICIGILVTFGVAGDPLLALAALPVVTLLQRSLSHVQLVSDSRTDAKTGLLNAATWHREASTELSRIRGSWSPTSLAIIDIDHFKLVNDTHGHLAGDRVLRVVADRFRGQLREGDLIGRFGGEEFAILLPHTSGTEAGRVAERLRGHIADEQIVVGDNREAKIAISITVSVGVAELAHTRQDLDELLAVADAALYQAKAAGRDQICIMAPGLDEGHLPVPPGAGPGAPAPQ
jgi:diguanylate cyclase (GGDEF)-like protein